VSEATTALAALRLVSSCGSCDAAPCQSLRLALQVLNGARCARDFPLAQAPASTGASQPQRRRTTMGENTRKDEVISRLTDGIARLTTSERWHEWLKVASTFHHYSFHNQLLIQLQCPTSSRVAGFHAWRKLGRNVR